MSHYPKNATLLTIINMGQTFLASALTKNVRVRRNAGNTTSRFAIHSEPSDNEEIYAGVQICVWILSFINRFSIPAVSIC